VAPSGGGKTTVLRTFAHRFGVQPDEAVLADGSIFRDFHAQYRAILGNGKANGGIWARAWPAAKGVVVSAKKRILKEASAAKKDLLISDTGSEASKLVQAIERLKEQGYAVSLCGIFADPEEILKRGIGREVVDGKKYNRDAGKLRKTFDAFAPAVGAVNGTFCLVLNRQGCPPELYREGGGGEEIEFVLEDALGGPQAAASAECKQPPRQALIEVELPPKDLAYIMEGNANVVCAYHGTLQEWSGCALRCRKGDNGSCRVDSEFASSVAVPLFGAEYVDAGRLVALAPANVQTIDEAIFKFRPPKRQAKRLDSEVRDPSGKVLALMVHNLMAAPVAGAKVVTVELKPKCGLVERLGLPCRYQLLQCQKLAEGKVSRLSAFDPVKLLSKKPALVREALEAAMEEPQNNFRIFVDGRPVFTEETLKHADSGLDAELSAANLPGRDGLLGLLADVLSSPSMALPERLKRAQAWAAGEAGHLAKQLYDTLRCHLGERGEQAEEVLARAANFALALEGMQGSPSDESGIALATEQMNAILVKAHAGEWSPGAEREVIRWLCRFLLGRTAHDVSLLVNLVQVPTESLTPALQGRLEGCRFRSLEALGLPGSLPSGIWFRASVVDTDAKPASRIPEYAVQLDKAAAAYYGRFSGSGGATGSTAEAWGQRGRGRPCRRRALRGPCRLEARPRRPQGPCGAGLPQVGRGRAGVRRLRPRPRGVPPGPGRLVAGHAEPPPRAGAAGGAGPEDGHQDLGHGRDPREGGVPGREGRLLHVWLPGSACRWLQVQGRRRASLQGRPEAWQGASERGRASGLLFPVSLFGGIEDVCSGEGAGDRRLVD